MEFDVIFLSIVRSGADFSNVDFNELERDVSNFDRNDEVRINHDKYVERIGMNIYGFLTIENRLCVALSRQKKLLIVVGDKNMFIGENAERIANKCVPAIPALYHLCEKLEAVDE